MQTLWNAALAPRTVNMYRSAYSLYKQFLELHSLWSSCSEAPPYVSEDILMYFVTFCTTKGLRYTTIKQYLAGIRHHYAAFNIATPLDSPFTLSRLYTILRGVKKSQNNVQRRRLPITYPILSDIVSALDKGILGNYDGIMLSCACTLAFACLLCSSEFLVVNDRAFMVSECILIGDITINHCDSYVLNLKHSKTDIFRRGVKLPVYSPRGMFCPVKIMKAYISLRRNAGAVDSDPLFVSSNGAVLSRSVFISKLRFVLNYLGFDASLYHIHSFRVGLASCLANANVPDHLIKSMGRWTSDCYTRYIHADSDLIRNAQMQIMQ